LFWEFLDSKQLDWTKISLSNLAAFVGWLRELKDDSAIIDITEDRSVRIGQTLALRHEGFSRISSPNWQ
jgi:integrase/recombinase XerD